MRFSSITFRSVRWKRLLRTQQMEVLPFFLNSIRNLVLVETRTNHYTRMVVVLHLLMCARMFFSIK